MPTSPPQLILETPESAVGPVVTETLRFGDRLVRLARPAKPERLLDLDSVADAYERDQYMPYWATLWPVARHLAAALLAEPRTPARRGIELGCGLGLPGVAALLAGIDVIFSDYDPSALRFAAENARLNGFGDARTLRLDWRSPPGLVVDVIIASDLTYEDRNIEPLVALFGVMLAPGGTVLLADQDRAFGDHLQSALARGGFRFTTTACPADPANGLDVAGTIYRIQRNG